MSRVSELIVKILGDASGFSNELKQVQKDLADADRKVSQMTQGFAKFGDRLQSIGMGLTAAITLPVVGIGAAALKAAGDMEALRNGLIAVTGSATEADRQLKELQEVAKLPGLGLKEAVQGAINLQAIGFEAQESQRILRTFGNALATVGRGREDLDEVIRQLGQMASRGKVTADNLKPIIERVPQVASIIKREFGTIDTEVLQKMQVSSRQLTDVLLTELGKLPPVAGGIRNDFENLSDAIQRSLAKVGTIISPIAGRFINEFATPVLAKVEQLAGGFLGLPANVQTIALAFGGLAIAIPPVTVALGVFLSNLATVKIAMSGLLAFITGPSGMVAALSALALVAGVTLYNAWTDLDRKMDEFDGKVKKTTPDLKEWDAAAGKAFSDELPVRIAKLPPVIAETHKKLKDLHETTVLLGKTQWVTGETGAAMIDFVAKQGVAIDQTTKSIDRYIEAVGRAQDAERARKSKEQLPVVWTGSQGEMEDMARRESIRRLPTAPNQTTDIIFKKEKESWKDWSKTSKDAMRQVSTAVTDFGRSLVDLMFRGGSFRDVMVGALESLGKTLARLALEKVFAGIASQVIGLIGKIPILGKALGGLLGAGGGSGGGGGLSGVAGGVGSLPSVISTVSSSIMGVVGAIGSVVSAVTGVISVFQNARQEGTLNAIEHEVRYSQIHLSYILEEVNKYLNYLKSIHDRLFEIRMEGVMVQQNPNWPDFRVVGAAAGNSFNITGNFIGFRDLDDLVDEIVRRLKNKGA